MSAIGGYEIERPIGQGGMGTVYLARGADGVAVAVKVLHPQFGGIDAYVQRFQREAELAERLAHPNGVRVLTHGQEDGLHYLVMEFVEGQTLLEMLCVPRQDSPLPPDPPPEPPQADDATAPIPVSPRRRDSAGKGLPPERVMPWLRQIAHVLQAAADIGLVHRDLKPGNIIIDTDDQARVLDFGLAKDTAALSKALSITGQSLGTPPYMSPEQFEGARDVDSRSDLYSLGATAYHLLTGRAPFAGPTQAAYMRQHLDEIPPAACAVNPAVPRHLSRVIDRLLAKDPADRHQTPAELIEDLDRIERGRAPLKRYRPRRPRRNGLRHTLVGAAAVVALVLAVVNAWRWQRAASAEAARRPRVVMGPARHTGTPGPPTAPVVAPPSVRPAPPRAVAPAQITSRPEPAPEGAPTAEGLRVPAGFQVAPGSAAEPHTGTGWAREIIHAKSGIAMVYIPAGSFTMGSPPSEVGHAADEIQHRVTLTRGFYLGKYEVTQGQWRRVLGSSPSALKAAGSDAPVEHVSWHDCQHFCRQLGKGFRLPTEAEWEYACRAGTTTAIYTGTLTILGSCHGPELDAIAWYGGNSGVTYEGAYDSTVFRQKQYPHERAGTHPVGQKLPNPWGLYDMLGNLWEWCQDWYGPYPSEAVTDPGGPATGAARLFRGGCWDYTARSCRAASRRKNKPTLSGRYVGCRVALSIP